MDKNERTKNLRMTSVLSPLVGAHLWASIPLIPVLIRLSASIPPMWTHLLRAIGKTGLLIRGYLRDCFHLDFISLALRLVNPTATLGADSG